MAGWAGLELYGLNGGNVTTTIENVGTGLQCLYMGALVPLIVSVLISSLHARRATLMDAAQAIYPTLIIVLVSLEQSGFEPVLSDKPMPHTPSHPSTLPQYSQRTAFTTEAGSLKSVQ